MFSQAVGSMTEKKRALLNIQQGIISNLPEPEDRLFPMPLPAQDKDLLKVLT